VTAAITTAPAGLISSCQPESIPAGTGICSPGSASVRGICQSAWAQSWAHEQNHFRNSKMGNSVATTTVRTERPRANTITQIVTKIGPSSAASTFAGPIKSITSHKSAAGIVGLIGLGVALWSASATSARSCVRPT
jgi:hypothetical protein